MFKMERTDEKHGRTGGRVVVEMLRAHRIDTVFCVPGESFLPILDALYDAPEIAVVTCRHEHGAAMMTEAFGKLTGRPAACLVTRGPGACNAAIGVHTAFQDSTPMLLLIGQVERAFLGREAFQEVDLARMFAPLAKRAAQIEDVDALPAALAAAIAEACGGRPGPVVLALPEDVLAATTFVDGVRSPRFSKPEPEPDEGLMERLHHRLGDATRPLVVVGGGGWSEQARADLYAFAAANGLPVACAFRRHDVFHNRDPLFVGDLGIGANPALVARARAADLLIAIGTRLGEITSQGYTLLPIATDDGPVRHVPDLVHAHPDAREPGRVFPVALAIPAGPAAFAAAARRLAPVNGERWRAWAAAARDDYLADRALAGNDDDDLDLRRAMAVLDAALPDDAVVTVDAGNFSGWPQRFLTFGGGRRLLGPCNGAMGYAVPAAIAAKHAAPARTVVACVGDGGFGMTGQELATAIGRGLAIVVLIFDNAMYGTIRAHQERAFPGRAIATSLINPDFAALARAYGASGETVTRTEAFEPALMRALAGRGPAVIALKVNPETISTRARLPGLRPSAYC